MDSNLFFNKYPMKILGKHIGNHFLLSQLINGGLMTNHESFITIFVGETGTGKTSILKKISEDENNKDKTKIVIDFYGKFSEYISQFSYYLRMEQEGIAEMNDKILKELKKINDYIDSTQGQVMLIIDEAHHFFNKTKEIDIEIEKIIKKSNNKKIQFLLATQDLNDISTQILGITNVLICLFKSNTAKAEGNNIDKDLADSIELFYKGSDDIN